MKLPVVSGAEGVNAFRTLGYEVDEQHGSHIILRRTQPRIVAFPFPTIMNLPGGPASADPRGRPHRGRIRPASLKRPGRTEIVLSAERLHPAKARTAACDRFAERPDEEPGGRLWRP